MVDISSWNSISRSLLLPLYFRAVETEKKRPLIHDEKAKEIIAKIDYDFNLIDGFDIIQTATVMREKAFDLLVFDFLEKKTESLVINIGAGLDTRFFRVDNKKVFWYELDLPEIIETRKEFFEESERYKFLSASAFDLDWHDKIDNIHCPVLLIASGVLFYFEREIVKKLFLNLKKSFPGSKFFFDVVSSFQAVCSHFNPVLNAMDIKFRWGINSEEELYTLMPDIKIDDIIYYFNPSFERLGWHAWYCLLPHVKSGCCIINSTLGGKDF
ncbi:MAG: methyltransferase [Deltaproteobacteria bacterium]|nr:MAG: methyltransferase [Deltaproteobacteria bacterium]